MFARRVAGSDDGFATHQVFCACTIFKLPPERKDKRRRKRETAGRAIFGDEVCRQRDTVREREREERRREREQSSLSPPHLQQYFLQPNSNLYSHKHHRYEKVLLLLLLIYQSQLLEFTRYKERALHFRMRVGIDKGEPNIQDNRE